MSTPTVEDVIARALYDHFGPELRGIEVAHGSVVVKLATTVLDVTIAVTERGNGSGETSSERTQRVARETVATATAEAAVDRMLGETKEKDHG